MDAYALNPTIGGALIGSGAALIAVVLTTLGADGQPTEAAWVVLVSDEVREWLSLLVKQRHQTRRQ